MQIEEQENKQSKYFNENFQKIKELLITLNDKKDSSNVIYLTNLTKRMFFLIEREYVADLLQNDNSSFYQNLRDRLNNQNSMIPTPQNETEISLVILVALYHYRNNQWRESRELLHNILFERPHLFYQKNYLSSLNDYLLYKYLNTIEFEGCFQNKKTDIYLMLKDFQNSQKELLFSNTYIFLMRNLLQHSNYQELNSLLKNCQFNENTQSVNYTKYLFYKGIYCERVGQLKSAYKYISEALRKTPTVSKSNRQQIGLKSYVLRVKKHYIILELLLNNLPSTQMFLKEPELENYKKLVRMVSNGQKIHFENFIEKESESFKRDGVWHLLMKMKSIVLRNALKRISIAYTKISEVDMKQKMGISENESFELNSFLAKSKNYLENFNIEHQNQIVNFAKTSDDYTDASIRNNFMTRIAHLNSLEKQVKKLLKFPEHKKEQQKKKNEFDIDSIDDLELDISMFSDDI